VVLGEKWCSWIVHCISSVCFSVLVSSTPSSFFSSSHGLRQGDPLSPLLFVIVMEALSKLLIATVHRGLLLGFSMGSSRSEVVNISHLLFADDTLVFLWGYPDQLHFLHMLFLYLEAVSGLKINLAKSVLVLVPCVDNVDGLASILGGGVCFVVIPDLF
jgi:hypothetical protein